MRQSSRIIRQAVEGLPEGDCAVKAKPTFKAPEGEYIQRLESARGEIDCYIISKGEKKPWRVKLRGASYNHLMALPEICNGIKIADLVAIFASFDAVMPEVDR